MNKLTVRVRSGCRHLVPRFVRGLSAWDRLSLRPSGRAHCADRVPDLDCLANMSLTGVPGGSGRILRVLGGFGRIAGGTQNLCTPGLSGSFERCFAW